jgi:hypothetical protein
MTRKSDYRGDFERFCHEIQAEARRRLLQGLLRDVRDVYKPAADVRMAAGDFIHQAVKEVITRRSRGLLDRPSDQTDR